MMDAALGLDGRAGTGRSSAIAMGKGALWTHRLRGKPLQLSCTAGSVWITREGDPDDVVLDAGASYGGAGRGLVVVEALEKAQISVSASGTNEMTEASPTALSAARTRWLVLLSLAAVYVIWGSTYFAIRVGLETMPPFFMAGMRFVIAGGLMYAALRLGGAPRPSLREWGAAAQVGTLLLVCGNGFIVVAQQWVSSAVAAIVVSTVPLWVAVFASLAGHAARRAGRADHGGSQVSRGEWAGLLVGFMGAALLHLGGDLSAGHAGALIIVLSPVGWALGSVYSRSLPLPKGPMGVAAEMLTGGLAMLVLSLVLGERLAGVPSLRSILALAYMIIFGSIIAFSAYMFLLRSTRPAIATSYAYINPLVAIALGIVLGGEQASTITWIASAIIGAGVLILSRARA